MMASSNKTRSSLIRSAVFASILQSGSTPWQVVNVASFRMKWFGDLRSISLPVRRNCSVRVPLVLNNFPCPDFISKSDSLAFIRVPSAVTRIMCPRALPIPVLLLIITLSAQSVRSKYSTLTLPQAYILSFPAP